MRFTLASMAAPGTDIVLSEERILSYRAFRQQNLECRAICVHESGQI